MPRGKHKDPNYLKKYFAKNKKILIAKRKKVRKEKRLKLLLLFGNKCKKCGFSDKRALQIDHINGGGAQHRKKLNGALRSDYFLTEAEADIEKFLSKYQLLCANCNWIKRHENNEIKR